VVLTYDITCYICKAVDVIVSFSHPEMAQVIESWITNLEIRLPIRFHHFRPCTAGVACIRDFTIGPDWLKHCITNLQAVGSKPTVFVGYFPKELPLAYTPHMRPASGEIKRRSSLFDLTERIHIASHLIRRRTFSATHVIVSTQ